MSLSSLIQEVRNDNAQQTLFSRAECVAHHLQNVQGR
jgi:hypothetical protein